MIVACMLCGVSSLQETIDGRSIVDALVRDPHRRQLTATMLSVLRMHTFSPSTCMRPATSSELQNLVSGMAPFDYLRSERHQRHSHHDAYISLSTPPALKVAIPASTPQLCS